MNCWRSLGKSHAVTCTHTPLLPRIPVNCRILFSYKISRLPLYSSTIILCTPRKLRTALNIDDSYIPPTKEIKANVPGYTGVNNTGTPKTRSWSKTQTSTKLRAVSEVFLYTTRFKKNPVFHSDLRTWNAITEQKHLRGTSHLLTPAPFSSLTRCQLSAIQGSTRSDTTDLYTTTWRYRSHTVQCKHQASGAHRMPKLSSGLESRAIMASTGDQEGNFGNADQEHKGNPVHKNMSSSWLGPDLKVMIVYIEFWRICNIKPASKILGINNELPAVKLNKPRKAHKFSEAELTVYDVRKFRCLHWNYSSVNSITIWTPILFSSQVLLIKATVLWYGFPWTPSVQTKITFVFWPTHQIHWTSIKVKERIWKMFKFLIIQ